MDSLIAYELLKKSGEKVSPPASFSELLSRGDIPTSLAVLDIIADLPLPRGTAPAPKSPARLLG